MHPLSFSPTNVFRTRVPTSACATPQRAADDPALSDYARRCAVRQHEEQLHLVATVAAVQTAREAAETAKAAAAAATAAAAAAAPETCSWVQCDECLRWRRIAGELGAFETEKWTCSMNRNAAVFYSN